MTDVISVVDVELQLKQQLLYLFQPRVSHAYIRNHHNTEVDLIVDLEGWQGRDADGPRHRCQPWSVEPGVAGRQRQALDLTT